MIYIIKDTRIADYYKNHPFKILTKDYYIVIMIKQLELLIDEIVIHRVHA